LYERSSIETTLGPAVEAIADTSIESALIVVSFCPLGQTPFLARYTAFVEVLTQVLLEGVSVGAAFEIPPTRIAPAAKPMPTFVIELFKMFMPRECTFNLKNS
jgi:hypothetical protein